MTPVEVAAVGAAISTTLNLVVNKLTPSVINWYKSITGVADDLQDLLNNVKGINSRLEKTGYEALLNDPSFHWLKRLKEIAYDVDDVADEFQQESDKYAAAAAGDMMSENVTKPKSFIFQLKKVKKINKIKERLSDIVKHINDYTAIINSIPSDRPVQHTAIITGESDTSWPDVNVASVVGRDEDKEQIISNLKEIDDRQKIKIISILGLGGSGKTTLAKLVFNDDKTIGNHFKVRLWVHVSQEFDVDKLVKKMFEAFADNNPGDHGMPYMRKTISDKLVGKRFLLVLDDVWIESRFNWEFLINIGVPGSRILLTTRNSKVAEIVGSTDPFQLPLLSQASSWQLFIQSYGMAENGLDPKFLKVGKDIVEKCGGIPLAIKVLAGALRDKQLIEEWEAMRDSNLLDVEGEEHRVFACLRLSYFHLPSHLKLCFTICSVLPKGHMIDKEKLIDQWIAHDMISTVDGVDFLEYIGHKYFSSLVQMSFLQDVEEEYGRVRCRMHDLIHDLSRSILREEISTNVPDDATRCTKGYRYFSLIQQPRKLFPKKVFNSARAIYVDKSDDIIFGDSLKNAKHLRSIIVNHILSTSVLTSIFQIPNLRYLDMSQLKFRELPEGILDIWSLQAVHLTNTGLLELPTSIGMLQKLRTLNLSHCRRLKCLPDSIGKCNRLSSIDLSKCRMLKALPNSIGDCQMISSINLHHCGDLKVLPDSIGKNKNLRVLRLGYTKIKKLPSSITSLRNLECLDLQWCEELVELPEGIGNLEKLQVLNLEHCKSLVELPEDIINLEKLQVLNLKFCEKLKGMPIGIGQLNQLQKLTLFVVGEGNKFAGISQLANISRISEELTIRSISHGMDPGDAHMACLKQKTNLQRLILEWKRNDVDEGYTELEQALLENLEPPSGIKKLEICRYSGSQCAWWMPNQVDGGVRGLAYFQFLRVMKLSHFPNLKHLHGLVELPCLEELELGVMPSLESISGGSFPSLVKFVMYNLPSLGEVWLVAKRAMSDGEEGGSCSHSTSHLGQVQVGYSCLTYLDITDCPKLNVKPHLPLSLQHWRLCRSSEHLLQSSEGLPYQRYAIYQWGLVTIIRVIIAKIGRFLGVFGRFSFFRTIWLRLSIDNRRLSSDIANHQCIGGPLSSSFGNLKKLELERMTGSRSGRGWELVEHMTALESLQIRECDELTELPEGLGSLASLRSLDVENCSAIRKLPECLGELLSLQYLSISCCDSLSSLPQSMGHLTSLQVLRIEACDALEQLPECLGSLCSLQDLTIGWCDALHELPECLGRLSSLCKLTIYHLLGLTCLPESICCLTSLEMLCISYCINLTSLPQGIEGLSSLKRLHISFCPRMESLPKGMKGLSSLKELEIYSCSGIKSLPKGIKSLTTLKELRIGECPDLERRCKRRKGEDWHLISRIPLLLLGDDALGSP